MFSVLKKAVAKRFESLQKHELFTVDLDKDVMWDMYLNSFPNGADVFFRQRTDHDCQCCKSFISRAGKIVAIVDNKLVSLWDMEIPGDTAYQVVVDNLAALVKSAPLANVFLHTEKSIGTDQTYESTSLTWQHLFITLPKECVTEGKLIGPKLADYRSTKDVMLRSLNEIKVEDVDVILDLISQNSLYRGTEHSYVLDTFRKLKVEYQRVKTNLEKDLFCWSKVKTLPASVSRIRSTVIGTLLTDLAEGHDLEDAVKSFESKVAPTNYKRPTALVTKGMIKKAQETIEELGFTSALQRRFATINDITINNIIFANRDAKKIMNVFDDLSSKVPEKVQNFDKVEEVSIDDFLSKIVPKAESLEVMFENHHQGNLVSLIAPVDPASKIMFKWNNNFSWSYTGELTDSIKERVKQAGGSVTGVLRCSLSWFNYDDLDLHLIEPTTPKNRICFREKISRKTGGHLDVDMNAGYSQSRSAVENITYPSENKMAEGKYVLIVNQYSSREMKDLGFEVEIEFNGLIHHFAYAKALRSTEDVTVAEFEYSHKGGLKILKSLPSSQTSRQLWGISTQVFHKVNVLMFSPNYWDEKTVGNKHIFFMLDSCLNDGKARGFFNEFLIEDLNVHRKVFEMVGASMRTDESDHQLSGLGFSSTQRNSILCRVKGSFNRVVKVMF